MDFNDQFRFLSYDPKRSQNIYSFHSRIVTEHPAKQITILSSFTQCVTTGTKLNYV